MKCADFTISKLTQLEIRKYIIGPLITILFFLFSIGCRQKQPNSSLTAIAPDMLTAIVPDMPIEMRKIQDSIDQHYLGVAGTGFIGKDEFIGFCEAESYKGGPWKPIDGYKHTVCGLIPENRVEEIKEENHYGPLKELFADDDRDIDIYIYPDPPFKWLIENSLRPSGSKFQPNAIGCEIALNEPEDLPINDGAEYFKSFPLGYLSDTKVCLYGAWVTDKGHNNQPEIHPIQQMWFTKNNGKEYHLYSMFDNSKRYNDPNDFNDCNSPGWIPPPLNNTFYISFSIPLNTGPTSASLDYYREIYTIEMPSSNNINLYPPTKSDEFRVDALGKTRIIVKKINNQYPQVSISDLFQYNGKLRGFIKIETSVMKPYTKNEDPKGGHAFLKVTKKRETIEPGLGF